VRASRVARLDASRVSTSHDPSIEVLITQNKRIGIVI
jgi:hypothetical protein